MKLAKLLTNVTVLEMTAQQTMEVSGVAYDSRRMQPGDAFVAISGFATDGNQYIPMAAEKGAKLVITEKKPEYPLPYVLVPSAREALAILGCNWFDHPAKKMKMVGVTGTNGKTSVTTLLKTVLEQACGAKVGLIGTIENCIGAEVLATERTTPESFELQRILHRMVEAGCSHCVMEVSSHALALDRVAGIHFDVAAFTNLTEDHLDFHKTMESYGRTKAMLFQRCDVGILNRDDAYFQLIRQDATCRVETVSLGLHPADLVAEQVEYRADGVRFLANFGDETVPVELGIPGAFSAYNALTALGIARALGIAPGAAAKALGFVRGVRGRVEVIPTPGRDFTVLTDYAHTPDALENVLRTVQDTARGRVVVLFGCGGDRDPIKRPIMGRIAAEHSSFVVLTSDNPRMEDPEKIIADILPGVEGGKTPYTVICNRRDAIIWALNHCQKDDILVLAGKGHETYQEINGEKIHFDEREEVARWLLEQGKGAEET